MKSPSEINARITQLKASQKNGLDNSIILDILETSKLLSEEQIKVTLKNQVENEKYKEARLSMWILEDTINPGI